MTFYEWRTQLRIYLALVLLAEGRDVSQAAHACGWSSTSGFIAAFTHVRGPRPASIGAPTGPTRARDPG